VSTSPEVSVLLPVFNGEAYVAQAVASVLGQTWSDFELIVIDDGSTDSTPDVLATLKDERLVVCRQANAGVAGALAAAAQRARGRYLARMDSDDESLPCRLERQVDHLETCPNVVVVGSSYDVVDENGATVWRHAVLTEADDLRDSLFVSNPFAHGSVMMRAGAYRAVGGYRDVAAQDFDLWARLARIGELSAVREVLYRWRMHTSGLGSTQSDRVAASAAEVKEALWEGGRPRPAGAAVIRARARHYLEADADLGALLRDRYLRMQVELIVAAARWQDRAAATRRLGAVVAHGYRGAPALVLYPWSRGSLATMAGYRRLRRFTHG